MGMLHTVNKSPYGCNTLESCLNHAGEGDVILLIEDGVYAAMKGGSAAEALTAAKGVRICALSADVKARGLDGRLVDGVEMVDYGGFVDLVEQTDKTQAWL